jgi:lipopolysaccharide/colanic/teichoic acid biosynthesis glycosyltransferase/LmbE family N-acetylglucosaminyl deacetylase
MTLAATIRRTLDVAVAGGALVLVSPVMVLCALAVRLGSPGPIFFRQTRIGEGGRPFTLLKFRTMRIGVAGTSITAAHDPRVTAAGRVLRRWKLDELPQLLNVLAGSMSLVGPRPELPEYVVRLGPVGEAYTRTRPGLADPATLQWYDEEAALADAADPERHYADVVLPAKAAVSVRYAEMRTVGSDLRVLWDIARRLAGAVRPGIAAVALFAAAAGAARADDALLVVAPHPDDEVIAAGGRIAALRAADRNVRVVVVTNGDYYGTDYGLGREGESIAALAELGVTEPDVIFLGYPDAGLLSLWNDAPTAGHAFFSPRTGRDRTYGNRGFGGADFHTVRTGSAGPYNRPTLVDDLAAAIALSRPDEITVTGPFDRHPDHRAVYYAVRDALAIVAAEDASIRPLLHAAIVHDPAGYPFDDFWRPGEPPPAVPLTSDDAWPNPSAASGVPNRFDPTVPYVMPPSLPLTPLVWTARARWTVPAAMRIPSFDANLRIASLERYATQASPTLWSFAKADEFAWTETVRVPVAVTNVARSAGVRASSAAAGQPPGAAMDGVVGGAPTAPGAEWAAAGPGPAFLELAWRRPVVLERLVLHDRPGAADRITAGRVSLDGGPDVPVAALANDGRGDVVWLPASTVTSRVTVWVDAARGTPGLAEVEAFGALSPTACTADAECDDGDPCTVERCIERRCTQAVVADGTACGDADDCNGRETCRAGACTRDDPPACADGDPCTADTCVAPGTCDRRSVCTPLPARGRGGCRLSVVGIPAGTCRDGDPACDGDGASDGTCRFDVVLCVNARTPERRCGLAAPVADLRLAGNARPRELAALVERLKPMLPTGDAHCVGPVAVPLVLAPKARLARRTVAVSVATQNGRRSRARIRLGCRRAAPGEDRQPPRPLAP